MSDDDEKKRIERLIKKTIQATLDAMPETEVKMISDPSLSPTRQTAMDDDDGEKVLNLRAMLERNLAADRERERTGGGEGGTDLRGDLRRALRGEEQEDDYR